MYLCDARTAEAAHGRETCQEMQAPGKVLSECVPPVFCSLSNKHQFSTQNQMQCRKTPSVRSSVFLAGQLLPVSCGKPPQHTHMLCISCLCVGVSVRYGTLSISSSGELRVDLRPMVVGGGSAVVLRLSSRKMMSEPPPPHGGLNFGVYSEKYRFIW